MTSMMMISISLYHVDIDMFSVIVMNMINRFWCCCTT